jgi:hypothetical protein
LNPAKYRKNRAGYYKGETLPDVALFSPRLA